MPPFPGQSHVDKALQLPGSFFTLNKQQVHYYKLKFHHTNNTIKSVKHTLNKNPINLFSCPFFQPRLTFAVQQNGRSVLARSSGKVHLLRALPARVDVVTTFVNPYFMSSRIDNLVIVQLGQLSTYLQLLAVDV